MVLKSRGIMARPTVDVPPGESLYLNLSGLEEIEEATLGSRLGSVLINKTGTAVNALSGLVHSLAKLGSIFGNNYRYASSGGNLYRRSSLTPGAYSLISSALSGQPWQSVNFQTNISSYPYIFIADANGLIKDNGLLAAPQNAQMFQPQYPAQAVAQDPDYIILDAYPSPSTRYAYTGISGGTIGSYVNTTTTAAITATGIQSVSVAAPMQMGLFQWLTIDTGGNQETVLAIFVTPTGFTANFTKTHANGATVTNNALSVTVPASTTATVALSFSGTPVTAWPVVLQQEDYIGLYLYVSDPSQISSITLKFDCGDGSFNSDYFWRTIGQGPLQQLLNTASTSTTAAADAVLSDSLGLYSSEEGGISQLNTGLNQWTSLLMQLSDFAGAGRADFNDPVFNWSNINGYQIVITANDNTSVTVQLSSLILMGGAGPDSFAGVSYGYAWTFYNPVDGTESNPSMFMTDVNPPTQTNLVVPRRQPVLLTLTHPTLDSQATMARVYRIGGTLNDAYRRLDEIPISGGSTKYTDIWSDLDIQQADTLSLTNDVPVTSTLPVPVNTTLSAAINTLNQVVTVTPASMANISVHQQILLGNVVSPNVEIVVVLSITGTTFTAFVQNTHAVGEPVSATAQYGVPPTIIGEAFDQVYFAGDKNNPSYLYYTQKGMPSSVSSAAYVPVSTPDDPITAIVATSANLYVSTLSRWWSIAPGSNQGAVPIPYPTKADHGCVAPNGWTLKDGVIYYQALDGFRAFAAGNSQYLSGIIEFLEQGIGTSPIVEADQTQFAATRCAWWNKFVFFSYIGIDAARHRLILDVENQRWRNDDVDAQSMILEDTTNTLLYGDSNGLIHQDRVNVAYDEGNNAGVVVQNPIPINMQTPYGDQNAPETQKQYQELTIDANTNGQTLNATLLFNDGQESIAIGPVVTTERAKVNLNVNAGEGQQAYKCSLQLTGAGTQRFFIYQAKIRWLILAQTRRSFDSYWLRMGIDESKLLRQIYAETTATQPITCQVYYDGSETPFFTFTIPALGTRNAFRQRLPAVKFRLVRFIFTCPADFQLWDTSKYEWKPVAQGKGWSVAPLMT